MRQVHPLRWHILLRWLLCLGLPTTALAWAMLHAPLALPEPSPLPALPQPAFPTEAQQRCLDQASAMQRQASPMPPDEVDSSLLDLPALPAQQTADLDEKPETTSSVSLSMVFFSRQQRLAVLNGIIRAEGQHLPDGRIVKEISRSGVLLQGPRSQEFFPWQAPRRVELISQPLTQARSKGTAAKPSAATRLTNPAATHPGDVASVPPGDVSPDKGPDTGSR